MQPTGKQFKNFIAARRAATKEAAAPTETPAPKNCIAMKRAEAALKAAQPAEDAQRLKPDNVDETPDAGAERQVGVMQADAHSDGHSGIAAAVTSRRKAAAD